MKRLGLAVVEHRADGKFVLSTHGLIHNPREEISYGEYLNNSIHEIVVDFSRFLGLTNPDFIVAERVPPGKLKANSELVFTAITVCKVLAYQWDIPWTDIAANTVKESVTGEGLANKTKIRNAVIELFPRLGEHHKKLKIEQKKEGEKVVGLYQDVFDAVAIAYTGVKNYIDEENINEGTPSDSERSI